MKALSQSNRSVLASAGLWIACVVSLLATHEVSAMGETDAEADSSVVYRIDLMQAQTQMVNMSVTFPMDEYDGDSIDIHLPTWRIGRYSILDFAGGIRGVSIVDDRGRQVPFEKIRKSTWRVACGNARSLVMNYRIYANEGSLRTRHVDSSHAFLSGTSVFMYTDAHREHPCTVLIDAPREWRVATGLEPKGDRGRRLHAPNYDVLVDSPIECGLHDHWSFEVLGKEHEIVLWPAGLDVDADRMIKDFTSIIETQHAVFSAFPYERYVFLIHAGIGGGGTEHLNNTIMQTSVDAVESSVGNRSAYKRFLGLVSHEFFHVWNVKALRPAGLVPYDYQSENYTSLLWVAEGTTSYYDDLTMPRAGLMKANAFLDRMGGSINSTKRRPGDQIQSVSASSFDAWIKFNHSSPDDVNSEVSFYSKGALVSMYLDLLVRTATENDASLDDVMKLMYERYPLERGGFTADDLKSVLSEVSGRPFDAEFHDYIDGTRAIPWANAIGVVGLELVFEYNDDPRPTVESESEADDDNEVADADTDDSNDEEVQRMRPAIGLDLRDSGGMAEVRSVRSNGPAYDAGIIAGDQIIAIDDRRVRASRFNDDLRIRFAPGQTIEILLMRRDRVLRLPLVLASEPDGSWELKRVSEPTDAQKAAYRDWIGIPWPGDSDKSESDDDDDDESSK